jgi:hypothetical protein
MSWMLTRGRLVSPSFTTGDLKDSSWLATRLYPRLPDAPILLSIVSGLNVLKCMIVVVTWRYYVWNEGYEDECDFG